MDADDRTNAVDRSDAWMRVLVTGCVLWEVVVGLIAAAVAAAGRLTDSWAPVVAAVAVGPAVGLMVGVLVVSCVSEIRRGVRGLRGDKEGGAG